MQNGDIKNFRLSNQCSAGNGMLLQAMADQFGVQDHRVRRDRVRRRAVARSSATAAPCSSTADRVNFQKEGYSKEELLAGLAQVLPKNVWQYVVQIPRMAALGTKFVLQGGTQYNLAAVKAQVDYIKERVPGRRGLRPPALRRGRRDRRGVRDAARGQAARALDVRRPRLGDRHRRTRRRTTRRRAATSARTCARARSSTRARPPATRARYISGFSCEKGTVESEDAMLALTRRAQEADEAVPEPRRQRGEAAVPALLRPGADARATAPKKMDVEVEDAR